MTTFTTEDRLRAERPQPKLGSRWTGADSKQEFVLEAIWNPNEEQDPWARYTDASGQEYTCRLEAFLARFSPRVD